jgi:uncharacterized membrane protein
MKVLRELLAALGLLSAIFVVVFNYRELPQRIAIHFADNGVANGWDDKSSLWFPVGIACVVYVVMTLVRFAPPSSFSGPFNPEQRAAAIPICLEMVAWLKAEMTWIFAGVTWLLVALAQGHNPEKLTMWLIFLVLGVVFATVIYHIARMLRLKSAQPAAQ